MNIAVVVAAEAVVDPGLWKLRVNRFQASNWEIINIGVVQPTDNSDHVCVYIFVQSIKYIYIIITQFIVNMLGISNYNIFFFLAVRFWTKFDNLSSTIGGTCF